MESIKGTNEFVELLTLNTLEDHRYSDSGNRPAYTILTGKFSDYKRIIFKIKYRYGNTGDTHYVFSELHTSLFNKIVDYDVCVFRHVGSSSYECSVFCKYVGESTISIWKHVSTYEILTVTVYGLK